MRAQETAQNVQSRSGVGRLHEHADDKARRQSSVINYTSLNRFLLAIGCYARVFARVVVVSDQKPAQNE